jgi:DnaJ-class molecular chaperone
MHDKVWDRCRNCYGTGEIDATLHPKRRCPVCEGMGYIRNSDWLSNVPEPTSGVEKPVRQPREINPKKPAKRD